MQLNVAYVDAILGAEYKVDTIRGSAWLSIPPGTQHGQSLRLQGAGVEKQDAMQNGFKGSATSKAFVGSHYFEIAVRVPVEIDHAERGLLQQLRSFQ